MIIICGLVLICSAFYIICVIHEYKMINISFKCYGSLKSYETIHLAIHYLNRFVLERFTGAGGYPSCHRTRSVVQPGQVTGL